MQKKDKIMIGVVVGIIFFFIFAPKISEGFAAFMRDHVFIMAFIKFSILCTLGECIALRITEGVYHREGFGIQPKLIKWGFIGMTIQLAFIIFSTGAPNILTQFGLDTHPEDFFGRFLVALCISTTMNLMFAPLFMTVHAVLAMHIEQTGGTLSGFFSSLHVKELLEKINWERLWGFTLKKTIVAFWIPAHTITFLLPQSLRILFAALLGIALGIILAYANKKPVQNTETVA